MRFSDFSQNLSVSKILKQVVGYVFLLIAIVTLVLFDSLVQNMSIFMKNIAKNLLCFRASFLI